MSERKYGISQSCTYGKHTALQMLRGRDTFAATLEETGFDGYEYVPARAPRQLTTPSPTDYVSKKILSVHQSFRTEKYLDLFKGNVMAPVFTTILEERVNSLNTLIELSEKIGKKTLVMYEDTVDEGLSQHFSDVTIQLHEKMIDESSSWNIKTIGDFIRQAQDKGYTSCTFDTTHSYLALQKQPGLKSVSTMIETLGQHDFLSHVHIAFGRIDSYHNQEAKEKQQTWARQMYYGKEGEFLDYVRLLHQLNVPTTILEFQGEGIKDIDRNLPYFWKTNDVKDVYKRFRDTLNNATANCSGV